MPEIKPFIVRTVPIPGESMLGYLTRALSNTGVRSIAGAFEMAGIRRFPFKAVHLLQDDPRLEDLAGLFGVPLDTFTFRLGLRDPQQFSRSDFLGTFIYSSHVDRSCRRVSPRALRVSSYHRMIWDLAPLTIDPETLEYLLESCPVCGGRLSWGPTFEAHFCDHCWDEHDGPQVDLRDHPQEIYSPKDPEALAFGFGLLSVDRAVRRSAEAKLHGPWTFNTTGEAFDLIVVVAKFLEKSVEENKQWAAKVSPRVTPAAFERACRLVLAGYAGVEEVVDLVRQTENRRLWDKVSLALHPFIAGTFVLATRRQAYRASLVGTLALAA